MGQLKQGGVRMADHEGNTQTKKMQAPNSVTGGYDDVMQHQY